MKEKILLPQRLSNEAEEYLISRGYELKLGKGFDSEYILEDIKDCDAVVVRSQKITKEIIDNAPNLKLIARTGAGYDNIDISYAKEKNIIVINSPGGNSNSVAEITLFYMLYCSRKFKKTQKYILKDYYYSKMKIPKNELYNKTLGIIGMGHIGKLVAQKAHFGFDMEIITYTKGDYPLPEYVKRYKTLEEVLEKSDYISLHLPSNEFTRNLIGKKEFEIMKNSAYLINTSRGDIIDEEELIKALKDKKIAGAGLDVIKKEPLKEDNPLLEFDNVIIGPHIGGSTEEAMINSSMIVANGIDDFFSGRTPKNIIPEMKE